MKKYSRSLAFTIISALSTAAVPVYASGFQTVEHSAVNLGRANSDGGLAADDLSALYYNPAAMMLLSSGVKLQFGASVIAGSTDYNDKGSSLALVSKSGITSLPRKPGNEGNPGTTAIPPFFYAVGDVSSNVKWGLGITVPFGLSTEYDSDWEGRYHAIDSQIKTIDINPSLAYRMSDTFSLGAGLSFQYVDATLSKAVFTGTPHDGKATVTADGWSVGFNAGVVFEPSEDTRIGLSYRSSVKHDVDGERVLEKLGPKSGRVGGSTKVELPSQVGLSVFHSVTPKFDVMASARWTAWRSFDELRLKFKDGTEDLTRENWNNTWTFALGGDYHLSKHMTLRAGVAYDESPIPGENFRTPRIPGNDRLWLSSGFSYKFNKNWAADFGYTHVFIDGAKIKNSVPIGVSDKGVVIDSLEGEYNNSNANIFSAQIRYDF